MFWMSDNSGFQVITYNLYRRAFKEFKHMYITIQPVRLIHRRCSFNVCILTIRKFTLVFLNMHPISSIHRPRGPTTSSAGGLPSYALAKSYKRSGLTTYQATVMQKFEKEDDLPVYGRRGTRRRRKIFDVYFI